MVYAAFVAGIVFMVFKSSTQNTDLVTTDYYEKELKYQDKIDEIARTAALKAPVEYRLENNTLTIIFPKDFTGKKLVGEAVLYCGHVAESAPCSGTRLTRSKIGPRFTAKASAR